MRPQYAIEVRESNAGWMIGYGLCGSAALYSDRQEALSDAKRYEAMGYEVRVREYVAGAVQS